MACVEIGEAISRGMKTNIRYAAAIMFTCRHLLLDGEIWSSKERHFARPSPGAFPASTHCLKLSNAVW